MIKVIKSEFIKLLSEKKVYVLIAIILVLSILSAKCQGVFNSMVSSGDIVCGGQILAIGALKEFSNIIFPMYIIIITADVVSEDYNNGIMKYKLISPLKKYKFILGKYLFILCCIIIFMTCCVLFHFVLGTVFIGVGNYVKHDVFMPFSKFISDVLLCILLNSISLCAFTSVIFFICLFIKKSNHAIVTCIAILVSSHILDKLSNIYSLFSLTKHMNLYELATTNSNISICYGLIISFSYIIIFLISSIFYTNKKDLLY